MKYSINKYFQGEMSLIGPRPERPEIDEKLIPKIPLIS